MANEVRVARQESSLTLYFAVRDRSGNVWDTSLNMGSRGFQAITSADWTDAALSLSEQGSTGDYYGDFPSAIDDDGYTIEIFERIGTNPDRKADLLLAQAQRVWYDSDLKSVADVLFDGLPAP